jgi:hypothetical protein
VPGQRLGHAVDARQVRAVVGPARWGPDGDEDGLDAVPQSAKAGLEAQPRRRGMAGNQLVEAGSKIGTMPARNRSILAAS